MRHIKMLVIAMVVVLAFAAVGASAASAHEFTFSKTGKLKGIADTSQTFEFSSGSGEYVLCDKLSVTGEVTALKAEDQAFVVQYEECRAVTFLGELSATVSAGDFVLLAGGTVMLTNPIEINIGGLATQTITAQEIGPATFTNSAGSIMVVMDATGIRLEGSLGTQTTGTYKGEFLVSLEGGTIEWA